MAADSGVAADEAAATGGGGGGGNGENPAGMEAGTGGCAWQATTEVEFPDAALASYRVAGCMLACTPSERAAVPAVGDDREYWMDADETCRVEDLDMPLLAEADVAAPKTIGPDAANEKVGLADVWGGEKEKDPAEGMGITDLDALKFKLNCGEDAELLAGTLEAANSAPVNLKSGKAGDTGPNEKFCV